MKPDFFKFVAISLIITAFGVQNHPLAAQTANTSTPQADNEIATFLPEGFGPQLFIVGNPQKTDFHSARVNGLTLKNLGFKYIDKTTTYLLTGTAPESYEEIPAYIYEYNGIRVIIDKFGTAISILFPNKQTLNQFLDMAKRNLPVDYSNGNYYSFPGMAAFSWNGLELHFDFTP